MTFSPTIPITKHKAGLLLSITFALLSLSLFEPLMSWVLILNLCAVGVRACLYLGWYPQPPDNRTINLLAILSVLALGWFGMQFGLMYSMISLLVTACSLKLMIMRSQKDFLQIILSLVFLSGCGYIFEQGLLYVGFYTCVVIALFTALALQYASDQSVLTQLKLLCKLSLQALPIAAVLFLVFPQLPPLWKMPSTDGTKTGLSDTIRPGDIASLSQSAELAFRVRFDSELPQPEARYWRAIVLEHFDGQEWTVSNRRQQVRRHLRLLDNEFKPKMTGDSWQYRVFAEPSRQRWLFTLDIPQAASLSTQDKIWHAFDYTFYAEQPLMSAIAYDVVSYPNALLNQTNPQLDKNLSLLLPEDSNPRTRQWVSQTRQNYPNNTEFIRAIQRYFLTNNFQYTLNPPLMQSDGIDAFLFDEQRGFCAHYAGAMAFALRLGGIPARLVAGYQGGEQLDEKVLSIYQYDAHVWVEAWFDQRGWVRFDPTGLIAPDRIQYGLEEALSNKEEFLAEQVLSLRRFEHLQFFAALRDAFSQMDYLWTQWVLGFDEKQQQDLFKNILGQITPQKLMYLMLGVLAFISALLVVFFVPAFKREDTDPIVTTYLSLTQWLERQTGVCRHNSAPQTYTDQVLPLLPIETQAELVKATSIFVQNQYAAKTDSGDGAKYINRELRAIIQRIKKTNKKAGR